MWPWSSSESLVRSSQLWNDTGFFSHFLDWKPKLKMPAGLLPLWPLSACGWSLLRHQRSLSLCPSVPVSSSVRTPVSMDQAAPLALLLITPLKMLPPNIVILRYSLVVGYDLTLGDSTSVTPTHCWGERTLFPPSLTIINGECVNSLRGILDAHKG